MEIHEVAAHHRAAYCLGYIEGLMRSDENLVITGVSPAAETPNMTVDLAGRTFRVSVTEYEQGF